MAYFKPQTVRAANIDSESATDGQVLTTDGAGNAAWEAAAGGALSDHDHSGDIGDGGTFNANHLKSCDSITGSIVVSGAGAPLFNGTYVTNGTNDGKTAYSLVGGTNEAIIWSNDNSIWMIWDTELTYYFALDDVATPDLCTVWYVDDEGGNTPPAPSVTSPDDLALSLQVLTADGSGGADWQTRPPFTTISVNADWSVAANAWTDIKTATGMAGRVEPGESYYWTLIIALWEGSGDSDDYATLLVIDDVAEWDANYQFTSAPSSGTAYIIGIANSGTTV